ncbi:MAG: serine hydrolase [Gemmatimonadales bacterium]|jgi:CubicO group peptidase (beta-lactamase class C family)
MRLERGCRMPRQRARPGRLWSVWLFVPIALAGAIEFGAPQTVHSGGLEAASDPDRLAATYERAAELPALSSLIVAQGGEVVGEQYFRDMRPNRQVNIKSASKSILSALVGIALEQGYLESLDQTLPELLPDHFPPEASPQHREITLRHLLTMTSGLQTTSFRNYGSWVASRDWVRSAIDRPMVDRPGGRMIYSTGNSHLVSAILTRSTGMSTKAFAQRYLFDPLGITPPAWDRDPQGFYLGGNNMALSPRDLLKIGELYLTGGSWDGRRILPEAWIQESWRPYNRSRWNGYGYGYFWWYRRSGRYDIHFAWGYGGQFVFVVPELELVVVATSRIGDRRAGRKHRREIHRLLDRYILPAVSVDRRPDASLPAGA